VFVANVVLSILAVALSLAVLAVFERISGPAAAAPTLLRVAVFCAAGNAVLLLLVSRAVRRANEGPSSLVRLPRLLLRLHLTVWLAIGLAASAACLLVERYRPDRAFMVFLVCLLAGIGSALASMVWSARHVTPEILRRSGAGVGVRGSIPGPRTPLREKITLVLGGVVFFSSAFGLFTSFAVQREVSAWYAEAQGDEIAAAVGKITDAGGVLCTELERLVPPGGGLAWSSADASCASGEALVGVKVEDVLKGPEGVVSVPSRDLEGIRYLFPDSTLVVLFAKPEWARRVLLVSLVFYTLLFLFSAWLAAQVARDLTLPIDRLAGEVKKIEEGDLSQPVTAVSADEIGDLSWAVDSMRRGLAEMIDTIRNLNVTLEEKVRVRTHELEKANGELTVTLGRLKDAQAQLVHAEKMASLGRLMSGLAHELNNPVNAILNSARPLREGLEKAASAQSSLPVERLKRAAGVVEMAAARTVELLASFSAFSRPDEEVRKPVDLCSSVDATLVLLQHRTDEAGTRVEKAFQAVPPVPCHPGEVNQVLMNLVANALEAVASKGAAGIVRISTRQEGEWVVVDVFDNGPGIPQALLGRIFEPFFTTKEKGTGLGLAISHQIVDRHRGRIQVDSVPGQGTTFSLYLPLSRSDD